MKQIIIELPENYANVLSITAVGGACTSEIKVTTGAFDLSKGTFIKYDGAKWLQEKGEQLW